MLLIFLQQLPQSLLERCARLEFSRRLKEREKESID